MNKTLLLQFFLFISFASLLSCKDGDTNVDRVHTYIGGEIVNPQSPYVLILKNRQVIDSVKLDENNYFSYQFDSLSPGLYFFKNNETQGFYIEPGDSLMLRVNTVEFDESLTFTGDGARRNNFLMDVYLENENDLIFLREHFNDSPEKFKKLVDSLKDKERFKFSQFDKTVDSENFMHFMNKVLAYDEYTILERYIRQRYDQQNADFSINTLPEGFVEHRKNIDFGDEEMRSYYPYYRFISIYLDNLTYKKFYKGEKPFSRYSYTHAYNRLKLIDSLVTSDSLKNNLTRFTTQRYLIGSNDVKNGEAVTTLFYELNDNEKHRKNITDLYEASKHMILGNKIPNVEIVNVENVAVPIHRAIKKTSIIFFWSLKNASHYDLVHSRVSELANRYPEVDFIGLNTDTNYRDWAALVKKSGYDEANEYQLDNLDKASKELIITTLNRAIILDKDARILENSINLFSSSLESELLGFLNKK